VIQPLSSPTESMRLRYDVVVVGSGYGGGIAASRLARAGKNVCVLERGQERQPGTYPNTTVGILEEVQVDTPLVRGGSQTALYDFRYNADINVVVGCGLGGTSLINAGICLRPETSVFTADAWPAELRDETALEAHFLIAEQMLRPAVTPAGFLALAKTTGLGEAAQRVQAQLTPVPILVNFEQLENDTNHVGVTQLPCVGCGDCVSGCNFRAKNTVIMNYLPDAKQHAAEIFTRTRVQYVEKTDAGWAVHGQTLDDSEAETAFTVNASVVVLAAGTLGSTEILLRSRERGLSVSDALGTRFSGNGDTIGFAYNTDRLVNGIGRASPPPGSTPVGPCSTAVIDLRQSHGMMVADGAIPGAVSKLVVPLLAAEAKVVGADNRQGAWDRVQAKLRELQSDVLGAYTGAIANTLFFLLIAHDDSMGRMYLQDDRLRIDWPGLGQQAQFAEASDLLKRMSQGLDGTYIENPVWNDLTNHNMVTGHPLGGCPMADSATLGVVNHKSQVFVGSNADGVHDGLYVMDGSVIPTSLGVNPLFTIAALAERSCAHLAQDRNWAIDYVATR
jgi:cholesterol oxidase